MSSRQYSMDYRPDDQAKLQREARMRDRQARGKDPYVHSDDEDESAAGVGTMPPGESFADRERKGHAMAVLDNPSLLLAHAQANNDSVSGQRLRFLRQLCGFPDEPSPPPPKRKDKPKDKKKQREQLPEGYQERLA